MSSQQVDKKTDQSLQQQEVQNDQSKNQENNIQQNQNQESNNNINQTNETVPQTQTQDQNNINTQQKTSNNTLQDQNNSNLQDQQKQQEEQQQTQQTNENGQQEQIQNTNKTDNSQNIIQDDQQSQQQQNYNQDQIEQQNNQQNLDEQATLQEQSYEEPQIQDENYLDLVNQYDDLEIGINEQSIEKIMRIRQKQLSLAKFISNVYETDFQRLVLAEAKLGEAYYNFKCFEQAIDHLTIALKQNGPLFIKNDESKVHQTYILKCLGECYVEIGNTEDAIQILQKSEQIYQNLYYHLTFFSRDEFLKYQEEEEREIYIQQQLEEQEANEQQEQLQIQENDEHKTEEQLEQELKIRKDKYQQLQEQNKKIKEEKQQKMIEEQKSITPQDKEVSVKFAEIIQIMAKCLYLLGKIQESIEFNQRVLYICAKIGDIANLIRAKSGIQLAELNKDDQIDQAIQFQQQAVEDLKQINDQPEFLAEQYEKLAKYYKQQKDQYEETEGEPLIFENINDDGEYFNYTEMKRIYQQLYGAMDKKVIKLKRQISILLLNNKQYEKAVEELLETEEMEKNLFGEKSIQVAKTQKVIGTLFLIVKDYKQSQNYFQKSLEIAEENNLRALIKEIHDKLNQVEEYKQQDINNQQQEQYDQNYSPNQNDQQYDE